MRNNELHTVRKMRERLLEHGIGSKTARHTNKVSGRSSAMNQSRISFASNNMKLDQSPMRSAKKTLVKFGEPVLAGAKT